MVGRAFPSGNLSSFWKCVESFQSFGAGVDIQENGAHQTQELVAQKVKKKLVDKSI